MVLCSHDDGSKMNPPPMISRDYDEKSDVLYVKIMEQAITNSQEIEYGIILNRNARQDLIGVQILTFSHLLQVEWGDACLRYRLPHDLQLAVELELATRKIT